MFSDISLNMMNIDPNKVPQANQPPAILSQEAKESWKQSLEDKVIGPVFLQQKNKLDTWYMLLSHVFDDVSGLGQPFIEPTITSNTARNKIMSDVEVRRMAMVRWLDNNGFMSDLTLSDINQSVEFDGYLLRLVSTAKVRLPNKVDSFDWLDDLIPKLHLNKQGSMFQSMMTPQGVNIGFDVRLPHISLLFEINTPATFIPLEALTPTLDPDLYSKFIKTKVWMPAIRKFRIKTLRRENTLF